MVKEENMQKEKTDIELYNGFLKGDKEAFNLIVKRYMKLLISFIMGYVKNQDVAEDLAQDTFLYMLINKKEYDFKYTLKTYLYTIAKCRAINYLKKNKKNVCFEEQYVNSLITEDISDSLISKENTKQIHDARKKLKKDYQIIIYLKDFQGFHHREISKILNKTIPQTKMLIHRARKSLKKILKKEGFEC